MDKETIELHLQYAIMELNEHESVALACFAYDVTQELDYWSYYFGVADNQDEVIQMVYQYIDGVTELNNAIVFNKRFKKCIDLLMEYMLLWCHTKEEEL